MTRSWPVTLLSGTLFGAGLALGAWSTRRVYAVFSTFWGLGSPLLS